AATRRVFQIAGHHVVAFDFPEGRVREFERAPPERPYFFAFGPDHPVFVDVSGCRGERAVQAFALIFQSRRGDPEVVGGFVGQAGDGRRYRDWAGAGPRRGGARSGRPVGGRGAPFELAFAYFMAFWIHARVQRGRALRDRRRGGGQHRGRRCERSFERFVGAHAGAIGVRRRDPEVVGRVRGEARDFRVHFRWARPGPGRRRARCRFPVGGGF